MPKTVCSWRRCSDWAKVSEVHMSELGSRRLHHFVKSIDKILHDSHVVLEAAEAFLLETGLQPWTGEEPEPAEETAPVGNGVA